MVKIDITLAMDVFGEAPEIPDPLPTHCTKEVAIANALLIGPVKARAEIILACDPAGIKWKAPIRQYGSQYGIWCDAPIMGSMNEFDADSRLRSCVQLSRLIHPTNIGFKFAGRLSYDGDGDILEFAPARLRGGAQVAYVADPTKNWLTDSHIEQLRSLIVAFDPSVLPKRVTQALFYHEYLHQLYYVDARWPMATTGVEALVHTDKYQSTAQFVQRALALQEELGVKLATETDLYDIYDLRSRFAHGKTVGELDGQQNVLYTALEQILRTSIRRAIEDPQFAGIFADEDTLRTRWPVA